ncbi:CAP domain-containing protein [Marmoricola sp. URHA0025 HA25]
MQKPVWLSLLVVSAVLSAGAVSAGSAGATGLVRARVVHATSTTVSAGTFETRLFARTNLRRANHGCRPLRLNDALVLAARQHSTRMAAENQLSHGLADEPILQARAVGAGYTGWRILAENLAWGQATPGQVFGDWVRSPGHRENLDNCRLRDVGVGVVIRGGRPWVTEDFGRRFG